MAKIHGWRLRRLDHYGGADIERLQWFVGTGACRGELVIYAAAYGYTLEKIAYRPLRNAPRLSPLISAIGASIFLMNYVQLVQTPDFLPFPELVPEFEFMAPISHYVSSVDMVILVVTAVTMAALTVLIKYTKIGKNRNATPGKDGC